MGWLKDCHIENETFSSSLGELGREEGSAHGPSGKCHFAFQGSPTKIKVFVKHCRGWHFRLLFSVLRSAPEGGCGGTAGDEKLAVGERRQK